MIYKVVGFIREHDHTVGYCSTREKAELMIEKAKKCKMGYWRNVYAYQIHEIELDKSFGHKEYIFYV